MRPILVVALAFAVMFVPPLVVDLWHFAAREIAYRKFLDAGKHDQFLRDDWKPSEIARLHARLIKERERK